MRQVTQGTIDFQAGRLLEGVEEGGGLSDLQVALLRFALGASATSLDNSSAEAASQEARNAGATTVQLQEVVTLMTAIGVHAFFESTRILARQDESLDDRGDFSGLRKELWDRYIGPRKYWTTMREEIPGFLESLLWLSPETFEAFITYVGLPFKSNEVDTLTKELISMAADATTTHRYLPGMRMHLRNAVRMGSGRIAIERALAIAAEGPQMVGVE